MIVLLVLLGAAVALLGLLVAGLLRSHAEILRSLHELGAGVGDPADGAAARDSAPGPVDLPFTPSPGVAPPRASAAAGDPRAALVHDLSGTTPDGSALGVSVTAAPQTLVAFLSSSCGTCAHFWEAFSGPGPALPAGMRLVVVTKGEHEESVAAVRSVAPQHVPVLMSSEAWADYEVPVSPYFVLVDGTAEAVVGEGAATTWAQVANLVGASAADARATGGPRDAVLLPPGPHGASGDRAARVDADLAAAGLHPGDTRLYPDATPGQSR